MKLEAGRRVLLALARNPGQIELMDPYLDSTCEECSCIGESGYCYAALRYRTRNSWRRNCRVIGKA